jgi:hypothetical protein
MSKKDWLSGIVLVNTLQIAKHEIEKGRNN